MKKTLNVFIAIMLSLSFLTVCAGYAAVTDTLSVEGSLFVKQLPKVIDYLYVSDASVVSGNATITNKDGSEDLSNPAGLLFLQPDFSSSTEIVINMTITNASASDYIYKTDAEIELINSAAEPITAISVTVSDTMISETEAKASDSDPTSVTKGGGTITGITVTLTASETYSGPITAHIKFPFGFASAEDEEEAENQTTVNNAVEALKDALNGENPNEGANYDGIYDAMDANGYDYVGNVVGSSTSDTQLISNIFGDTLNSVSFSETENPEKCTVMLKGINLDNDSGYERVIMYLTPTDLSTANIATGSSYNGMYTNSSVSITTYVVAVDIITNEDGTETWVQHGNIYKGSCNPNVYEVELRWGFMPVRPDYCDSINTDTWVASDATYTAGNGVTYDVTSNMTIDEIISKYDSIAS